jgi:hypothetical protein
MFKAMTWQPLFRSLVAPVCLLAALTGMAEAELAINVASGTVTPGGSLTLDIGLESTTPPQNLSEFELILQITPLTATAGTSLQFVDPQSEAFLDDADYVFAGNSDAVTAGDSTVGGLTATQVTFFDFTANFADMPVTSGQLLATVDVGHLLGGLPPEDVAGDQFEISVAPSSLFSDAQFNDLAFSSTPGVVTVGPVVIPEPGSVTLLAALSLACFVRRGRRGD